MQEGKRTEEQGSFGRNKGAKICAKFHLSQLGTGDVFTSHHTLEEHPKEDEEETMSEGSKRQTKTKCSQGAEQYMERKIVLLKVNHKENCRWKCEMLSQAGILHNFSLSRRLMMEDDRCKFSLR